jgi:hypothetical protein
MAPRFSRSRVGGGMKAADRPSLGAGEAATSEAGASRSKPKLIKVIPLIWTLVKPLRWLLAGSFLLMIVNRLCSFAVPICSRYLVNDVMYKRQLDKLPLIVGAVVGATLIQGITQGLRMKNACEDLAHVLVLPCGYFSLSAQALEYSNLAWMFRWRALADRSWRNHVYQPSADSILRLLRRCR